MNKIPVVLLIISLILPLSLSAQLDLFHQVPLITDPAQPVSFILEIRTGFDQVARAGFNYREAGEISYSQLDMLLGSESRPELTVVFSDLTAFPAGMEYYFEIYDDQDNVLAVYPSIRPEINPFKIAGMSELPETTGYILLSPDLDYQESGDDLIIAVSYYPFAGDLDLETLIFTVNGINKTDQAEISSNMLVYKEDNPAPGSYSFRIKADFKDGTEANSRIWTTTVRGQKMELPLDLQGLLSFRSKYSRTDYEADEDTDEYADLDLKLRGRHRILNFDSRIFISSLESSDAQPVNRYRLGLEIPHFKIIGGDHSPYLSDLTAKGKNIRGVHFVVDFSMFKLLASYGNLRRSIKGNAYTDSTSSGIEYTDYETGSFRRETINFRAQTGSERSFFWALNLVKVKDKTSSLAEKYYISAADSLPSFTPKDNLIVSMDTRLALLRQRLVWGTEVAMSLYNSNIIGGALSLDSLQAEFDTDLFFDPEDFESIFVINKNVEPILPNLSNLAYRTYLRALFSNNLLNISYSATGSSYNSLAASYIPKDARILSVVDNLNLLQGRLNFNFGFNYVSDNVYDEKSTTTENTGFFIQGFYHPAGKPYFSLGYNGNYIKNGYNEDDDEGYPLDIGSGNLNFNMGYEFSRFNPGPVKLTLGFTNSYNRDEEDESFDYRRNHFIISARSRLNEFPMETFLSYSLSLNDNKMTTTQDTMGTRAEEIEESSTYNSIFTGCKFHLLEDRLQPFFDFKYTLYSGDIDTQNQQMLNLGTSYRITRNLFAFLEAGFKFYRNQDNEDSDYNRYNLRFKATYRF